MKVVLDTNVWVSGLLLPRSIPGQIISEWRKALFGVVISSFILDELRKVLNYPKIKKRISLTSDEIDEYLTLIRFFTEMVEPIVDPSHTVRDENDKPILATLIVSQADYLITGDEDLLTLKNHYPIIKPSEFAFDVLERRN